MFNPAKQITDKCQELIKLLDDNPTDESDSLLIISKDEIMKLYNPIASLLRRNLVIFKNELTNNKGLLAIVTKTNGLLAKYHGTLLLPLESSPLQSVMAVSTIRRHYFSGNYYYLGQDFYNTPRPHTRMCGLLPSQSTVPLLSYSNKDKKLEGNFIGSGLPEIMDLALNFLNQRDQRHFSFTSHFFFKIHQDKLVESIQYLKIKDILYYFRPTLHPNKLTIKSYSKLIQCMNNIEFKAEDANKTLIKLLENKQMEQTEANSSVAEFLSNSVEESRHSLSLTGNINRK